MAQSFAIHGQEQKLEEFHPVVHDLSLEFDAIFAEPTQLPPSRECDHWIPLEEGTKPLNPWSYRHSHGQKDVIEKLVKKMLDSSIIQVSHNPFSSPVLLVQKNDNTWRFCELYSDEWFSKIDIWAGYQKHMALSIYEKEFLAILLAVQKWRYYLESKKFIIKRAWNTC